MKKIRKLWYAKATAWIMITLATITFLGSCVGAVVMEAVGVFSHKYEYEQKEIMRNVCNDYAVRAVYNMLSESAGTNQTYFADKGFRYGIIEAENLEQVNPDREDTYVERNFNGKIELSDCYTRQINVNDNTEFEFYDGLFGGRYDYYDNSASYVQRYYAERICYDVTGGIFYYEADNCYYPVQSIRFNYADMEFAYEYDREKNCYNNKFVYDEEEIEIQPDAEEEASDDVAKEIVNRDKVVHILNQSQLTFNQLDHTAFDHSNWQTLMFDEVRELNASELTMIDSQKMKDSDFPKVMESYIDSNYTLNVVPDMGTVKTYWVVSFVDDSIYHNGYEKMGLFQLITNILNDDDHVIPILNALLLQAYHFRAAVFVIMLVSFLLMIGSLVFLWCAAGYRAGSDEVVETFLDKIPLDVLTCIVFLSEILMLIIIGSTAASASIQMALGMFLVVGFCMGSLLLWYLLSVSVRIKKKKLLRSMLWYMIASKIYHALSDIFSHVSVLWKTIFMMFMITFVEILLFAFSRIFDAFFLGLLVFLLIKAVVYVVVLRRMLMLDKLYTGSQRLADGALQYHVDTTGMTGSLKQHGDNLNCIANGINKAVDERMRSERMKTELITNVSHDIKTPLTSIINYVDLMQKEALQNDKAVEYLEILDRQSSKLKKLIEDLVEASKASSGCLPVHLEKIDIGVLFMQAAGEFEDRLKAANLELVMTKPDDAVTTMADGRHLWRVIDNVMNNICKYSQPGSRVYLNLEEDAVQVRMILRNVSHYQLNITSEELMERFVRGDKSRNTEGHGLGLSIAKSLMELMNGQLRVVIDGDLFKVIIELPKK